MRESIVGHRLGQLGAMGPDGAGQRRSGSWVKPSDAATLAAVSASAACRGHPGEFIPAQEKSEPPAWLVELCGGCPVREACLDWAVRYQERGYWAGTTTSQRRALQG